MGLARRLKAISALVSPPVMLDVVPAARQGGGVDRTCMLMATPDARALDSQDVHKVSVGRVQQKWAERDRECLKDRSLGQLVSISVA